MRLGMVHKGTDLFRLLDQPAHVIFDLVRLTGEVLDDMQADRDE